jgi:alpha-beta hydrolase superfamily lysophospholipase
VLLICGNEDPVSKCGKGVIEVYEKLTKQKVNAKVKIYDGRHEVFNEPKIKEQVLIDVLEFIEK